MAKTHVIKIHLGSPAHTCYFYVTKKNARAHTAKIALKKYESIHRKPAVFRQPKRK